MVKEWSYFKFLAMTSVDAHMEVEPWTASFGAKGEGTSAILVQDLR